MELINHVFDADAAHGAAGVTALLLKGRIVLIADTLVHEWPDEEDLANIAERAAADAGSGRHHFIIEGGGRLFEICIYILQQ